MNNKYELMSIVDAQKTQPEKDEVFKQISDAIIKGGGKVINGQVWLDKHKMSFKIKKKIEATYYLINLESDGSALTKIRELLKLNEEILRFSLVNKVV